MSYRFEIAPAIQEASKPKAAHDLGQKIKAAVACGLSVFTLGMTFALALALLGSLKGWPWALPVGIGVIPLSIGAGVIVACYFVFAWSRNVADRDWRIEDRARRQQEAAARAAQEKLEEATKKARNTIINEEDDDGNPVTINDVQRLHLVALEIIDRFYRLGQSVTREAMTEGGICTQPQWNLVSRVMVAIGLKIKKRMREDLGFEEAWQIWRSSVEVDGGYIWILDGRGGRKALEQV